MHNHKVIYRSGFIVLLAISVMLCPLATGIYSQSPRAYADEPFQTLPPVNATFTAPIGTSIAVPTPIPTLGPGQSFDEDSKPRLISSHGDDYFGWGELAEDSDLVLIWVTDQKGKHYLVVEKDNDFFQGDERLKNGFVDYIGDQDGGRTRLLNDLGKSKTAGSVSAFIGIGFGLLILLGPAGWTAALVIGGFTATGNAAREIGNQTQIETSIAGLEFNLLGKYTQMIGQLSQP